MSYERVRFTDDAGRKGPVVLFAELVRGLSPAMARAVDVGIDLPIGYCPVPHPSLHARPAPPSIAEAVRCHLLAVGP